MTHAMLGGGDYDRFSAPQLQDAAALQDMVSTAADRIVPDSSKGAVVIADYGCAQGMATAPLIRSSVERIRARAFQVPIHVIHNDVLLNDWAGLFEALRGEGSYLGVNGGPITPMTAACSFYQPVMPPGLLNLGLSFAALQWLERPGPASAGTALFFDQLAGAEALEMANQAHQDWSHFLMLRALELAPGGSLVLDMMGRHDLGPATGHTLWAHIRNIAEDLVSEGRIAPERLEGYVFPVYERTLEEVRRPFSEGLGAHLHLEQLALRDSQPPAWRRFRADGDLDAFVKDFVGFVRAFSEPSLKAALDPAGGGAIEELYHRLERHVRATPEAFDFTVHVISALISRQGP